MVDTVDSKRHSAGHKFRGQLDGALVANGVTVAPRGTFVYGTVTAAQQSGRLAGKSVVAMEFTDIMIDDQLYPIATEGLAAQTGGEGGKTGAKVGAGVSLVTSGESLNVPVGPLLETVLRIPLDIG